MRLNIDIMDATPEQLIAIANALNQLQKPEEKKLRGRPSWSKIAIKLANQKTPQAPYGIKMDGTPRKKPGRHPY